MAACAMAVEALFGFHRIILGSPTCSLQSWKDITIGVQILPVKSPTNRASNKRM